MQHLSMNPHRKLLNLLDPVRREQSVPKLHRDAASKGEYLRCSAMASTARPLLRQAQDNRKGKHGTLISVRTESMGRGHFRAGKENSQ